MKVFRRLTVLWEHSGKSLDIISTFLSQITIAELVVCTTTERDRIEISLFLSLNMSKEIDCYRFVLYNISNQVSVNII